MKIHEFQAKEIFSHYQVPTPKEIVCDTEKAVRDAANKLNLPVVIKAQVLTGGRGKAGGIKIAKSVEEAVATAKSILGMDIKGYIVNRVLVAEAVSFTSEYYVGLTIDRSTKSVILMASREGGVEIEKIAKSNPDAIIKYSINPEVGLLPFVARKIAFRLFDNIDLVHKCADLLVRIYHIFLEKDASLLEINPLVVTGSGNLCALDGKMDFDDNALFRQSDILKLRDPLKEERVEIDAKDKGLSFIRLDGTIGCMVNGAGLAMATMDMIKLYGGTPANFLDIGGSSSPQKVIDAMKLLLSDNKVKAIMINIFGGITRCDDVAKGLVDALKQVEVKVPIVVRLSGTNAEEGLSILKGLSLTTVKTMSEAAEKVIELVGQSK